MSGPPTPPPARPSEEEERRSLRWLVDVRENGGPLERHFARTVIETLAWFEAQLNADRKN